MHVRRELMLLTIVLPTLGVAQPLAAVLAADHCDFQGALSILKVLPEALANTRSIEVFRVRILIQLERGEEAVALAANHVSSGSASERSDALLLLGLAESIAYRFEASLKHLNEARALGADAAIVDGAIGANELRQGRIPRAESTLRGVLKKAPGLSGALYNLAIVRVRQGYPAEAAGLIRQAWFVGLRNPSKLKLDPDLKALIDGRLIEDLLSSKEVVCTHY